MKISKKTAKILNIVIVALALILIASTFTTVYAADMFETPTPSSSSLSTKAQSITGMILGIAQVIGAGVAVIMLIVLAIKYISAAPNDKAEIKKHAVVYIVGAIILFASTGLVEIIKNWAVNINN